MQCSSNNVTRSECCRVMSVITQPCLQTQDTFLLSLLTVSMSFRWSMRLLLSLTSADACQVLIWSRNRCSFLISFLRSASYFSFWLLLVACVTLVQMSSNVSTPSVTFFRHRSISPAVWGGRWVRYNSLLWMEGFTGTQIPPSRACGIDPALFSTWLLVYDRIFSKKLNIYACCIRPVPHLLLLTWPDDSHNHNCQDLHELYVPNMHKPHIIPARMCAPSTQNSTLYQQNYETIK